MEAVTFDHYMTLFRQRYEPKEDIIYPILRCLISHIDLDMERFLGAYDALDRKYRAGLSENFIETTLDEIVIKALAQTGHEDVQTSTVEEAVNIGLETREITWFEDAQHTLNRLIEQGYPLGLISNTHWRWLPERFKQVEPFFQVITLSYQHGYAKPHPSIFHSTVTKLGVKPANCLHVGDDLLADAIGARKAGMKTAYIRRGEQDSDADIEISRLSEVLRFLT